MSFVSGRRSTPLSTSRLGGSLLDTSSLTTVGDSSFDTSFASVRSHRDATAISKTRGVQRRRAYRITNPWSHIFTIPLLCGRDELPQFPDERIWSDRHHIRLFDAKRPAICAGLRWEVYLHPLRGSMLRGFGLSVLPVDDSNGTAMPAHYKLQYTVTVEALSTASEAAMDDSSTIATMSSSLKHDSFSSTHSISEVPHNNKFSFTRTLESIPCDPTQLLATSILTVLGSKSATPSEDFEHVNDSWLTLTEASKKKKTAAASGSLALARASASGSVVRVSGGPLVLHETTGTSAVSGQRHSIHDIFKSFISDLPFAIDDLHRGGCVERDANWEELEVFRLKVTIKAQFVAKHPTVGSGPVHAYTGLSGALLFQTEKKLTTAIMALNEANNQLAAVRKEEDREKQRLQTEVENAKKELKRVMDDALGAEREKGVEIDALVTEQRKEREKLLSLLGESHSAQRTVDSLRQELVDTKEQLAGVREERAALKVSLKEAERRNAEMEIGHQLAVETLRLDFSEKMRLQQESNLKQTLASFSTSAAAPTAAISSGAPAIMPLAFASPALAKVHRATAAMLQSAGGVVPQSAERVGYYKPHGGYAAYGSSPIRPMGDLTTGTGLTHGDILETSMEAACVQPPSVASDDFASVVSNWSKREQLSTTLPLNRVAVVSHLVRCYRQHVSGSAEKGWAELGKGHLLVKRKALDSVQLAIRSNGQFVMNVMVENCSARVSERSANVCQFTVDSGTFSIRFLDENDYNVFMAAVTGRGHDQDEDEVEEEHVRAESEEAKVEGVEKAKGSEDANDWNWNMPSTSAASGGFGSTEEAPVEAVSATAGWGQLVDAWTSPAKADSSSGVFAVADFGSGGDSLQMNADAVNELEDDNALEITFKPIVSLTKAHTATGTEKEALIGEVKFTKLYRWGQDVTGVFGWKARATNSTLQFYKDETDSGLTRVICREGVTEKLRLNHYVPHMDAMKLQSKGSRMWAWKAVDSVIADEDDSDGHCQFAVRFADDSLSEKFESLFNEAFAENVRVKDVRSAVLESVDSGSGLQLPALEAAGVCVDSDEEETESLLRAKQFDDDENDTASDDVSVGGEDLEKTAELDDGLCETESEESGVFSEENSEENTPPRAEPPMDDATKEWMRKKRSEAATKSRKSAALFGDATDNFDADANDSGLWNTDVTQMFATAADEDSGDLFSASLLPEKGVDLEFAAHIQETDVTFGSHSPKDAGTAVAWDWNSEEAASGSAESAQKEAESSTEPSASQKTALGMPSFAFADSSGVQKPKASVDKTETAESEEKPSADGFAVFGADSGWGTFAQTEEGWGAGGGDDDGGDDDGAEQGFGSFGNGGFDFSDGFGAAQTTAFDAKDTAARSSHDGDADADDNCMEVTFKPIVKLERVQVASGHENEELLGECQFRKLFRWGKDVTGVRGWKQRSLDSKATFWKSKENGRIRIVVRENVTEKLRLNHFVPGDAVANWKKEMGGRKVCQWVAGDSTIREEESDETHLCPVLLSFESDEQLAAFTALFEQSMASNAQLDT